jgi:hypothetical protein
MEHDPFCETNRFSASQEISHILRYQKIDSRIHRRLPPVPILSQINPVHASHRTSLIQGLPAMDNSFYQYYVTQISYGYQRGTY